jgi:hypothetical protein
MNNMSAFGVPAGDRAEIVDALYRFGAGQDLRDRRLFDSAFTLRARLDFTGPARRLGASIPVFEGRQAIGDRIFSAIAALDTVHTVTNPRVTHYDGKHAQLSALVEAQHLVRGDHGRSLLLQNLYRASLVLVNEAWLIEDLRIENLWMTGDPSVLFPELAPVKTLRLASA